MSFLYIYTKLDFPECVYHSVNKQLNDKERVAAALENNALLDVVERCLTSTRRMG